jgi:hypothetical protein
VEWIKPLLGHTVGLDTAPLIYFIEKHPQYFPTVRPFFEAVERGDIQIITSTLTLTEVVFRISPRLYYPPQSRPWPGDFDARNRLGLLSHTTALAGGRSIRELLLPASARRYYGVTEALTWLCSSDRSNLRQRVEARAQIQRNTVFSAD